MKEISTVILLQELQRRIKDFTGTDDDVFANVAEQTVHDLHTALHLCLGEYTETLNQRMEQN